MQYLLYCITRDDKSIEVLGSGVAGFSVEQLASSDLRCFFSRVENCKDLEGKTRETALQFHRSIQHIFQQTQVIPFRFPTLVDDSSHISNYLQQNAQKYASSLIRLRNMVQMEIRIEHRSAIVHDVTTGGRSGAEYLRSRQARQNRLSELAEIFQKAAAAITTEWRVRSSADKIRCFVLIDRSLISQFEQMLARVGVSGDVAVRVTGPWPPTEFIEP